MSKIESKTCMFPYPSNIPIVLLLFGCLVSLHIPPHPSRSRPPSPPTSGVQPTGAAGDEKQFENLWMAAVASWQIEDG